MIVKSDLHTHTCYCDGTDTPAEMASEAYKRGFSSLGFSGHSFTPFDKSYCMSVDGTEKYLSDIKKLKEEYKGRMKIFCGIEQDYYSGAPSKDYDYVIGSVHYLRREKTYIPVDECTNTLLQAAYLHYNNDIYALAEDYYCKVSKLAVKTKCNIVGHFDLITKFNESYNLLSEDNDRYRKAVIKAIDALAKTKVLFEVNTGAVTRNIRRTPYPSEWILKELKKRDAGIVLSGDCHSKETLGDGFDNAMEFVKKCGYTSIYTFNGTDFEKVLI